MKCIAVLITCHNRKDKTINCLESLYNAINTSDPDIKLDIFLVDDGSIDGTSAEILNHFLEINLIIGSGELYWAGGTRLAWETALKKNKNYDAFLLLNDDVTLIENFLLSLLSTHKYCKSQFHQPGIYVCSTKELNDSKISYGGIIIKHRGIKLKMQKIFPSEVPIKCLMANANILMVTMDVVKKIGILDPKYIHRFADYDYTLRASRKGIPILVCPEYGGICKNDHNSRTWLSPKSSLKERINYLNSPLGLSYKEQVYYLKKNFKFQFPYYFIMLWIKTLFPIFWDKFKQN